MISLNFATPLNWSIVPGDNINQWSDYMNRGAKKQKICLNFEKDSFKINQTGSTMSSHSKSKLSNRRQQSSGVRISK